jgi:hypothetical protein
VSVEPHSGPTDASPFVGVRTILVPPDIVAVQRRSPAPVKKTPAWHPRPNAGPTERSGGRQWFSDRLFVEAQNGCMRGGLGASIGVHVLVATFAVTLATRFERTLIVRVDPQLVMPAMLLMPPISDAPSRGPKSVEQSTQASQPSDGAPAADERPPAPVEIPTGIEPETGVEGSLDGKDGGVAGGTGDTPDGEAASLGPSSSGPLRLGSTFAPPRKIKDVKPVYPQVALSAQARGLGHHRSHGRNGRQGAGREGHPLGAAAGSGRSRSRSPVGVRADAAERRPRRSHHDSRRQLRYSVIDAS